MFYIYAITFPDGKQYVGATRNVARRAVEHRYALNSVKGHYNRGVQACWDKYKTFSTSQLHVGRGQNSTHLEQRFIDKVPVPLRLNLSKAMKRTKGKVPSAKQLKAMKAGRKPITDVQRARMSTTRSGTGKPVVNKTTGQVFSNARCAAESIGVSQGIMSKAVRIGRPKTLKGFVWRQVGSPDFVYGPRKKKGKLGRPLVYSKEGAARKAAATRAAKNKAVQNLDTGEVYPSATAAAEALSLSRSNLSCALSAKHRQKTFGGFRWRFVDAKNSRCPEL